MNCTNISEKNIFKTDFTVELYKY